MPYIKTDPKLWSGRESNQALYLHEKVQCIDIEKEQFSSSFDKTIAVLGYACDEGVKRNQGRVGAVKGADAIRKQLGKMPNHMGKSNQFLDVGSVLCVDNNMESAQNTLAEKVAFLLSKKAFPIVLGGGHDIAYGNYTGIKKHLKNKSVGIINFDAHFDLRSNSNGNNSGTPFYQIAQDCQKDGSEFNYLCLGIRKDANDKILLETAKNLGAQYIENRIFNLNHLAHIQKELTRFIEEVDHIYVTIDLDGFSSAYAMGVSAPSPMGFSPDIVLECLEGILASKKLISMDIAEMNPTYDNDNQTAKLAASLAHYVMHAI